MDRQTYKIIAAIEVPVNQSYIVAMKKGLFKLLVNVNNIILPRYTGKDPATLTRFQQAVLGFRYWALINSL